MIRLVVSDVDGTMLDETEIIPDKISELAELIEKKNVLFTIASGREYSQVKELEKRLNIQIPIIMCNGTAARHLNEFAWCESIPSDLVKQICELADKQEMTVVLSLPDAEYAYRKTPFVEKTIVTYGRFEKILNTEKTPWSELSVQKLLLINDTQKYDFTDLYKVLEQYENQLTWVDYGRSMDIVPKGCTKAAGVARLASILGIPEKEIMAVGDSFNDLEMLKQAGVGVAVNNAVEKLKDTADYVCREKYLDGVMEAVEKFC